MNDILRGNTVGSLTQTQHAILVGSMLGDGTLRRQGNRQALYEVFRDLVITPPKPRLGNGSRVAYRFTTRRLYNIIGDYILLCFRYKLA